MSDTEIRRAIVELLLLLCFGAWVYALIDVANTPSVNFTAVGKSKAAWVILIVLFGIFAAVPYFIAVKPKTRG